MSSDNYGDGSCACACPNLTYHKIIEDYKVLFEDPRDRRDGIQKFTDLATSYTNSPVLSPEEKIEYLCNMLELQRNIFSEMFLALVPQDVSPTPPGKEN